MSIDGFISDMKGDINRLYPDLAALDESEMLKQSIARTGAVVIGKHAFDMGDPDWYADNYEYQVPIFVLTHTIPEKKPRQTDKLMIIYVTDGIVSAMTQAKQAAGEKDVSVIGGANTFQQCINAGLYDEIHLGIMPIFLREGLRLFDNITIQGKQLEKVKIFESGSGRTDIIFRVLE